MAAPGVVLEEIGTPTVTVRKSQTVPVFVGFYYDGNCNRLPLTTGCIRVDDSLHLRRLFPNAINTKVHFSNGVPTVSYGHEVQDVLAIQHYFDNGGGPCYLLPIAGGTQADLLTPITAHPEISLLALATATTNSAETYQGLTELLQLSKAYFLIKHGTKKDENPIAATACPEQTARYRPFLEIKPQPWRSDEHIVVTGHTDTSVTNLAALKKAYPALYALADAQLRTKYAEVARSHIIAPSAAVAAAYCQTDRTRGVWKAPANLVVGNAKPTQIFTDAEQGPLNLEGVNIIRSIQGQTVIWGARTGAVDSDEWRYIPVRRLFNQVERDVAEAMRAFVFEPNTRATWVRAKSTINSYLYTLWQLGGLKGDKPDQGYQVKIDESTMTQDDINAGRMNIRIALAAVRPAEFIILQFTQEMAVA